MCGRVRDIAERSHPGTLAGTVLARYGLMVRNRTREGDVEAAP